MTAARAYREGRFRRVIVTGAEVGGTMRDLLVFLGLPAEAVQVQPHSRSTREDALYTARMLAGQPGRKVLLTSDDHVFRARRAFAQAGLAVLPWPAPDALKGSWMDRWPAFVAEAGETAKIVYYFCRGWI